MENKVKYKPQYKWKKKNRERVLEYQKEYYQKNKERLKKMRKELYYKKKEQEKNKNPDRK